MVAEFSRRDEPPGLAEAAVRAELLVRDCSFARGSWQKVVPAGLLLVPVEVFAGVEEEQPFSSSDDSLWPVPFACL